MPISVDLSDVPFIAEAFERCREDAAREGRADFVLMALRDRFGQGAVGDEVRAHLLALAPGDLHAMLAAVPTAGSPADVLSVPRS